MHLTGNNSRQFNKHVVNQNFIQWVEKGENAFEIRETVFIVKPLMLQSPQKSPLTSSVSR